MASYYSTTLELSELFRTKHSFKNVFDSVASYLNYFVHGGTEIKDLWLNTFVLCILYLYCVQKVHTLCLRKYTASIKILSA